MTLLMDIIREMPNHPECSAVFVVLFFGLVGAFLKDRFS